MGDTRTAAAASFAPDERLTELVRHGDAEAFAAIVRRYQPELLAHARRLVPEGRADDVVQQAFLNAWTALRSGSKVSHLRGWLHAIVRNAASRTRQPIETPLPDDAVAGEPLEELVQHRATARAALTELNELPVRQRDALLSTAVHGVPRARVASRMGLSEGAVRQLVHRARSALREAVPAAVPYPLLRALGVAAGDGAGVATSALSGTDSGGALAKLGAVLASGAIATGFAVDEVSHAPGHHHATPARATMVSKDHRGHARGLPSAAGTRAPVDPSARSNVLSSLADDGRFAGDDAERGASRRGPADGRHQERGRGRGGGNSDGGDGPGTAGHGPESSEGGSGSPGRGGHGDRGGSPGGGGPSRGGALNGDGSPVAGASSGGDGATGQSGPSTGGRPSSGGDGSSGGGGGPSGGGGSSDGGGSSGGGGSSAGGGPSSGAGVAGASDSSGGGSGSSGSSGDGSSGSSAAHG